MGTWSCSSQVLCVSPGGRGKLDVRREAVCSKAQVMSARPDIKPTGNSPGRAGRKPGGHGEQNPWTRAVPAARGEGEGRPALFPDESSLAALLSSLCLTGSPRLL